MEVRRVFQILEGLPEDYASTVPVSLDEEVYLLSQGLLIENTSNVPPEVVSAGLEGLRQYDRDLGDKLKTMRSEYDALHTKLVAVYDSLKSKQNIFHRFFTSKRLGEEKPEVDRLETELGALNSELGKNDRSIHKLTWHHHEIKHSYLMPSGKLVKRGDHYGLYDYKDAVRDSVVDFGVYKKARDLVYNAIGSVEVGCERGDPHVPVKDYEGYIFAVVDILFQGKEPKIDYDPQEYKEYNRRCRLVITSK